MYYKKGIVILLFAILVAGCARPVRYKVSQEFFNTLPGTLAILPVEGEVEGGGVEDAKVKELFRNAALKKLKAMNYNVLPVEQTDEAYAKYKGSGPHEKGEKRAKEVSAFTELIHADSVLYIDITEWEEDFFLTYAALKLKAEFTLYSKAGAVLWHAKYSTKESEMRFDRELLKMGVIRAYEPRIEKLVDTVLSTLPPHPLEKKEEEKPKRFFDWL